MRLSSKKFGRLRSRKCGGFIDRWANGTAAQRHPVQSGKCERQGPIRFGQSDSVFSTGPRLRRFFQTLSVTLVPEMIDLNRRCRTFAVEPGEAPSMEADMDGFRIWARGSDR
jgi:hypothetical protein